MNKHWEFIGLGICLTIDIIFNLDIVFHIYGTTAFSIGWLIMMIIFHKDLREKYAKGGIDG